MNYSQENVLAIEADSGFEGVPLPQTTSELPFVRSIGRTRWVFLALVVFFLIALGYSAIYRAAWNDIERTDFTVYRNAGQAVIDGTNLYEAHNSRGWNYVYPPPFAILMTPFAKLSVAWGVALWYAISLLGLASASVMAVSLARAAGYPTREKNAAWSLYEWPVFLVSPWLMSGLIRCQASEFMVWLMIAAVYFWWRGRHVLGGVSLAGAALFKVFPVALLAYFAWRRQWRFVGAFFFFLVLGGLFLPASVFGWQKNLDYLHQWGNLVAGPALAADDARRDNPLYEQLLDAQKPRNQSLEALFLSLDLHPQGAKSLLAGFALGMLAAMAWAARRADAKTQVLVVSAFVTWNLLIPPISESHYFGLLLLPLAVLTAIAYGETDGISRRLAQWTLLLDFCLSLWSCLDKDVQLHRLLCWAGLAVWFCLLVVIYRRGKKRPMVFLAG